MFCERGAYLFPKLKDFSDNNFKFDENGRKFYKQVENSVGKGEIACYEQFLLYPQCFLKTYTTDMCLFGKGLTLSQSNPGFYVSAVQVF